MKFIKTWGTTSEDVEFENYQVVPIWEPLWGVNEDFKFAITMKWVGNFDGTGGATFRQRASRKSESILVAYFKTEAEMDEHPYLNGDLPFSYYAFCWDRNMELVNGCY